MEFLKELLGEELYGQVVDKLKDSKVKLADLSTGEYVSKEKFERAETQANEYKTQLDAGAKELETLKGAAGVSEELKKQIETLQAEKTASIEALESKLDQQAFDFALDKKLEKEGAKNPTAVKALLDLERVKLDGDTFIGLEEQLKSKKESDGYMFDVPTLPGGTNPAGGGQPSDKDNPWVKESFNLTKQGQLIRNDPAKAKILAAKAGYKI